MTTGRINQVATIPGRAKKRSFHAVLAPCPRRHSTAKWFLVLFSWSRRTAKKETRRTIGQKREDWHLLKNLGFFCDVSQPNSGREEVTSPSPFPLQVFRFTSPQKKGSPVPHSILLFAGLLDGKKLTRPKETPALEVF